jgi:hypothetical protein
MVVVSHIINVTKLTLLNTDELEAKTRPDNFDTPSSKAGVGVAQLLVRRPDFCPNVVDLCLKDASRTAKQ